MEVFECSDIYAKNYVLNTVLVLVDGTLILCKFFIKLGCF